MSGLLADRPRAADIYEFSSAYRAALAIQFIEPFVRILPILADDGTLARDYGSRSLLGPTETVWAMAIAATMVNYFFVIGLRNWRLSREQSLRIWWLATRVSVLLVLLAVIALLGPKGFFQAGSDAPGAEVSSGLSFNFMLSGGILAYEVGRVGWVASVLLGITTGLVLAVASYRAFPVDELATVVLVWGFWTAINGGAGLVYRQVTSRLVQLREIRRDEIARTTRSGALLASAMEDVSGALGDSRESLQLSSQAVTAFVAERVNQLSSPVHVGIIGGEAGRSLTDREATALGEVCRVLRSNAIKHGQRVEAVEVTLAVDSSWLRFSVALRGPTQLFDTAGDPSEFRSLTAIRALAQVLGGSLTTTLTRVGSTVYCEIPR